MMFLLRTAFWLAIVVLLLPTDAQQQSQVYGTAEAAVKDVTGFCSRNPSVCEKGKDAFSVFVHKAQFGAQMVIGFVKDQTGGSASEPGAAPAMQVGPATQDAPAAEEVPATEAAPSDMLIPPSSPDMSASPGAGADLGQSEAMQLSQALPAWMPESAEPTSVEALPSQNTLRAEDLGPAWSGPQAGA